MENYSHRLMLGCSATALLLAVGGTAYAQENAETVVVTSTRLTNAGFNAPTPLTVVGAADIEKNAQPSVFEAISQLPALQGSVGASGETGSTTTGLQGLSTLGLRGLSPLRTLVLFDGQRVVGGNFNGAVDVSQIPQMLIKRVEVVTGGASASWGSDAVAGVVNFVTDTKFEGFKANMMAGITTYGDDANTLMQFAAGRSFMGGRLHVEVSGEYEFTAGVQPQLPVSSQFSALPNYGGRRFDVLSGTTSYTTTATGSNAPAGYPTTIFAPIIQNIQTAAYGLVTSGPKLGNSFGANGTAQPFQYAGGNTGAPGGCYVSSTGPTNGTLNGVVSNNCIGSASVPGDLTDVKQGTHGLIAPLQRGDVYGRISYDLTPDTNIYFTINEGQVRSMNVPAQGNSDRAGLKIGCDNAYLASTGLFGIGLSQAQTQANCQAAYPAATGYIFQYPYFVVYPNATPTALGSPAFASPYPAKAPPAGYLAVPGTPANAYPAGAFGFGTDSANINQVQKVFLQRDQRRYVIGGDGAFSVFGTDWTWSSYAEHGETDTGIHITNMPLSNRFNLAMDAIADPVTGNIECRDPTARANGCVPFNPFGNSTISPAALAYVDNMGIDNKAGPWAIFTQRQEAFSFSVNGAPIEDWAGKIAVAAGIEYREEEFTSRADPYSSGVTASTPASLVEPCTDPSINCGVGFPGYDPTAAAGNAWNAGNYHDGSGSYHVSEMFLEFGVPLLNSEGLGKLDLDIAGRVEAYSTAGEANTWKVGLTWDTPLTGVRLRALQSRDVRAPNLSELYQPPQGLNGSFNNDFNSNINQTTRQLNIGNTLLSPEVGSTTQVGVVYQPEWLPGFQGSIDYWRITVRGAIASLSTQQVEDQCFNGVYCGQDAIATANGVNQGTGNTGALGLPGAVTAISSKVFNLAGIVTDGMDIEAAYAFDLENWDIPGNFVFRTLATDISKYIVNPGIVGQATNVEIAGVLNGGFNSATYNASGGNVLTWKLDNTQSYQTDDWGLSLTERWLAGGQFQNKNFVLCNIGSCPVGTIQHPTTNYDKVDAVFYLDVGGSYKLSEKSQLYFKVDNVVNTPPPHTDNQEGNNLVYDILGRMYRIGVRFND